MPKALAVVLLAALPWVTACESRHGESQNSDPIVGGPEERVPDLDEVVALVETLMDQGRVPGAAVALIRGGELVGERVLGLADASSGDLVTAETLFEAASLSKPVFAYIVLKLAERGDLDLDRPLSDVLPHPDLDDPRRDQLSPVLRGSPLEGSERATPQAAFEPSERSEVAIR